MPLSADTLEILVRAGLKGDALIAAARAVECDIAAALPKRTKGAERQARYRQRHPSHSDVTSDVIGDITGGVTPERNGSDAPLSLETKTPTPPKTQTLSSKENTLRVQKKGSEAFERFKAAYPKRLGSNPWEPAAEKFERAVKAGADPEQIISAAQRYASEQAKMGKVGTEFIMQAKAWLNQKCWQDYPPAEPIQLRELGVFVECDTPEWRAWKTHRGRASPTVSHEGRNGWWFESQWPPARPKSTAELEAELVDPEFLLRRKTG